MNRKINRRTRRMATQVIDFNPNDIHDIKTLETTGVNACKTDQSQLNSQISKLFKQLDETKGTENKEHGNCETNSVLTEELMKESKKDEQNKNEDLIDVTESQKDVSDDAVKLEEDNSMPQQPFEDNANGRGDVIQLNTNDTEQVTNDEISDFTVDQCPHTTAIVEQRQFVFKDLLNKFKSLEKEKIKSNRFEVKTQTEIRNTNLDPNETVEAETRPVNVNLSHSLSTVEDSVNYQRRPVDITERAFDFKKLISIFNK